MNTQSYIELFHLLFLRQLEGKLDKKLYALKGGCNLRFYFKSIRYSEDIDFDVTTILKQTLASKVTRILEGIDFKRILQSKDIAIEQVNPAKQTDTTQRWKILLKINNSIVSIPTKIEFSRRKMNEGVIYEPVDKDIITQYNLYPVICNHYSREIAFLQKIEALIHRTETQARDVFDLKWLLDRGAITKINLSKVEIEIAITNALSISYVDFKGQVVAYLVDDYKSFYDSAEKWNAIQLQVIHSLQENLL
jgi:predicted nucleotidyltransferase component of viral defense system